MSEMRTTAPSGPVRTMMSLKSFSDCRRPLVTSVRLKLGDPAVGAAPTLPMAACWFWSLMAFATSSGEMFMAVSRSGSSHTRMEYCSRPNSVMLPTPFTRDSTGCTMMLA